MLTICLGGKFGSIYTTIIRCTIVEVSYNFNLMFFHDTNNKFSVFMCIYNLIMKN